MRVSDLPAPCIRQWKSCLDLWRSLHGTVSRARSFFCWPHRSIAAKSESIWAFISELKAHPSSNTFSYLLVPPVLDKEDCYEGHNWSISHITEDESHDLIGALFPFCKVASIWFRFLFWHYLSWAISDKHDWQLQLVEEGGMLYYLHVERAWEVDNNGRKKRWLIVNSEKRIICLKYEQNIATDRQFLLVRSWPESSAQIRYKPLPPKPANVRRGTCIEPKRPPT